MALPSDAFFEILSRTSLKALDKSKTVSKDWNQLVHGSNFMPTYCKNTNATSGFYIQYLESDCKQRYVSLEKNRNREVQILASSTPETREVEILASSMQGLLFVVRGDGKYRRCYVCKPCTNQWQALPNPKLRFQTVKAALVVVRSEPLRYKIVRIYAARIYSNSYKCEIFDSETWTWKTSSNDMVLSENEFLNSSTQSVEASGLIYWLTDQHVIAFNPADETHSRFPLPPESESCSDFCHPSLIEYEGKLGFVNSKLKGDAELWVVDDSKTHSWRFIKQVEASTLDQTNHVMLKGFYNREIALLKQNHEMVFYNLQSSSIEEAVNVGYLHEIDQIFPFRSDCEPVNLKGGSN